MRPLPLPPWGPPLTTFPFPSPPLQLELWSEVFGDLSETLRARLLSETLGPVVRSLAPFADAGAELMLQIVGGCPGGCRGPRSRPPPWGRLKRGLRA